MNRPVTVTDCPERSRFEWAIDGEMAIVTYRREGSVLWLLHAGVPPALGGRGIGTRLVADVLAIIAARGERIVPVCSFIVRYLEQHPEQRALLA